MVGAFFGGVATWLHWIPHFKTVPEPPAQNPADNLLRKRDALPKNAIEISSYQPQNQLSRLTLRKRASRSESAAAAGEGGKGMPKTASGLALRTLEEDASEQPQNAGLPGGQVVRR